MDDLLHLSPDLIADTEYLLRQAHRLFRFPEKFHELRATSLEKIRESRDLIARVDALLKNNQPWAAKTVAPNPAAASL